MSTTLWILGAPDVEMAAIERLLREAGETVAHTIGASGRPVHPGNAYAAVGYALDGDTHLYTRYNGPVVLIECGGDLPPYSMEIDHHKQGDPGYGRPPEKFLEASSIGQVFAFLCEKGKIPLGQNVDRSGPGFRYDPICGEWVWEDGGTGRTFVPDEVVLVAAADHCLESAYRGKCPGVDPEKLMKWRAETRAAFQKRSVEEVLADVEKARKIIREENGKSEVCNICLSLTGGIGWCGYCNGTYENSISRCNYVDLRGRHIPELPEAAAREGVAFLSTVKDRDGREKVTLMAASSGLVKQFMEGKIVEGLKNIYGDPARGFAGGYIS